MVYLYFIEPDEGKVFVVFKRDELSGEGERLLMMYMSTDLMALMER
jgi:hypothetical protein